MKHNKAAGWDSIVVELLKSGEPSLVNVMIQQVWISETLPENWTEKVLWSSVQGGG
jgi:hypothetical protein